MNRIAKILIFICTFSRGFSKKGELPQIKALFFSSILTIFFILLLGIYPRSAPLVQISAETAIVNYIVGREELAKIRLYNAEVGKMDSKEQCEKLSADKSFTGFLAPAPGARVSYTHHGNIIVIKVLRNKGFGNSDSALGSLEFEDETKCKFKDHIIINYELSESKNNAVINPRPLPIVGPAEIGMEMKVPVLTDSFSDPTGRLKNTTITILGRSFIGDALYPAQDVDIKIPEASKLTSISNVKQTNYLENSWYGIVSPGITSFHLSATTEAKELKLYQPGKTSDAETFKTSIIAQIINDPSLALISFGLATFFIIWPVIYELCNQKEKDKP